MTEDTKQLMKHLKKLRKEISEDPQKAKEFGIRMGLIDKDGNITEHGKTIGQAIAFTEANGGYKGPGQWY